MASSGEEEVVHLSLQGIIDLNINVIAGSLLGLSLPQLLHSDHVVDDDRVRWVQQWVQPLWDLRKLHAIRLRQNFIHWSILDISQPNSVYPSELKTPSEIQGKHGKNFHVARHPPPHTGFFPQNPDDGIFLK